eukprot:scaffold4749_cov137-Isochrysis_galbana.AAC.5
MCSGHRHCASRRALAPPGEAGARRAHGGVAAADQQQAAADRHAHTLGRRRPVTLWLRGRAVELLPLPALV